MSTLGSDEVPQHLAASYATGFGAGMVRLLDHDPVSSSMLLERLDGARTLASIDDDGETRLAPPRPP